MSADEFNVSPKNREEFLSQFEDTSTEITVMIRCVWDKGNGPFPKVGDESLAHADFILPWLASEQYPFGRGGQIWWFCKRRILGYPYPPCLKRKICYKLRVRKCKTREYMFYLEDVIEKDVDVAKDDSIYETVKQRILGRYTGEPVEFLFYNIENVDMSKVKNIPGMGMASESAYFSAIKEEESDKPVIADGGVLIPVDDKDFAKNKGIRLKAGKIYRVRARQIDQEDLKVYAVEELLEKDVDDKELDELGRKALEPVQYVVDGIGEFTISREDQALLARGIVLHDNADGRNEISVIMECDHDDPTRADKSAGMLHKIFDDIDTNERKIFSAIADDIADEDGNIEIWEDERSSISKEDFIKRLSICVINIDDSGAELIVDLDEMFTDHVYSAFMDNDGNVSAGDMMG